MRLPDCQPQRALVVVFGYLVVVGLEALGLVLMRGPLLGGLLAALLAAGLTVPLAVLGHLPERG